MPTTTVNDTATIVDPTSINVATPLSDTWCALFEAEQRALLQRRKLVLGKAAAENTSELELPRVGLSLSGGGVRSATFALGLMRGMAQSRGDDHPGRIDPAKRTLVADGLLGRLDYLSSVSGGGYTAGMYGRLVSTVGLREAEKQMADSKSPVLEWLRRNGRYLTPAGSGDIAIAVVTFMRALLAIHLEFMFACIFLGLIIIAPHLWQHSLQVLKPQNWEPWFTPWWALATVLWLLIAPGLIAGYWGARDGLDQKSNSRLGWRAIGLRDLLFVLVAAAISFLVLCILYANGSMNLIDNGLTWPAVAALALVSLVVGQALVQICLAISNETHALTVARLRNQLTRALRAVTIVALAVAGMGVLDRLSWWILEELQSGNDWLWSGVGVGGLAVLVLRSMMQPLQQMAAETGTHARDWLPRLLNLGSIVGLLALILAWLALLQWFVFAPTTFDAFVGVPAWMRAALVGGIWAIWVLLTASNGQMANTSSLHSFYRARLTRAYLAVGNPKRVLGDRTSRHADVTEVVEGDDTRMSSYHPETEGGPIHLVNTCLNQTRDDKSGLYNADRKGIAVTATWRGLEVGANKFIAATPEDDTGTLGRWVAVSGAAASPGAGSYTSRGLALLVYFLGVRLGLWVRAPRTSVELRWLSHFGWRFLPKPLMLASEASATFFGVERPWWYLSDGGHFENAGVYALIKRELDFIILSDASSDAHYNFGDIENLVRKARIDFGAEIDFYTREEAAALFTLAGTDLTVLSPEEMDNNHSSRGVLLARIRYRERPGPSLANRQESKPIRPEGTLLVIKPNLHDELDADLLAYAQKHPDFPHESTGDQSFDEAQWESYHRLGEDFGRALHESWLAQLPGWRRPASHPLKVAARLRNTKDPSDTVKFKAEPLWRRSAQATAIGTTLGLGASGTLLLSMWQVQDQLQRHQNDEQMEVRQMFTEVSKGLQSFDGACPNLPDHIVTQASRLLELRGSPSLRPLEQGGVDRIASRLAQECQKPVGDKADCVAARDRLQNDLCAQVDKQPAQGTALNYWRPGISPRDQAEQAGQAWKHLIALLSTEAPPTQVVAARAPAPAPAPTPLASKSEPTTNTTIPITEEVQAPPVPSTPEPLQLPSPPVVTSPVEPQIENSPVLSHGVDTRKAISSLEGCKREGDKTTLYVQVYDEDTRRVAEDWRRRLLSQRINGSLKVAPVENVSRGAELRQQRRPVPWPKPTFVLHDPSGRPCAEALGRLLVSRYSDQNVDGRDDEVWVRDLPETQPNRRPGVIELWLPPGSVGEMNDLLVQNAGSAISTKMPPWSAFCYQEDRLRSGSERYSVHCHATRAKCEDARGPNPRTKQSACEGVALSGIQWTPRYPGWKGSWFEFRSEPFETPFPKVRQ